MSRVNWCIDCAASRRRDYHYRANNPETFCVGQCCEAPANCMHIESVGPEGVAFVSGRRRNGGPLTREAFESDPRREGFEVIIGGQQVGFTADVHAHDFNGQITVLDGEITLTRDGKPESSRAGQCCDVLGRKASPTRLSSSGPN
jgi:hypothetical protein